MGQSSKRPCLHPGCGVLVTRSDKGRCTDHKLTTSKKYDKERGTAASRGYGARWQACRLQHLKDNPLCVMCKPKITAATLVDHIVPVTSAGDPLFYEPTNHQSLCRDCHSVKTRTIDGKGYGSKQQ